MTLKKFTAAEVKPIGNGKVSIVKGTSENDQGQKATIELKAWSNGAYIKECEVGKTITVEVEEKENTHNGETRKERWIKTANGVGQQAGGSKGPRPTFGGNQKSPADSASIAAQVVLKEVCETYRHERSLELQAMIHNSGGKTVKWEPALDGALIGAAYDGLTNRVIAGIERLTPTMGAKGE